MLFFQAWKRVNQFDDLCNSHVFLEYKITRNSIYTCVNRTSHSLVVAWSHIAGWWIIKALLFASKKNCPRDHPLPNCHHPGICGTRWYPVDSYEPTFKEMRSSMHSVPPHILKKTSRDAEMILFGPPPNQPHLEVFGCIGFVRETRGTMLGWFRTAIRVRFSVQN